LLRFVTIKLRRVATLPESNRKGLIVQVSAASRSR
jgi:hypothetical protein